jgi:uncharacterized protein YerC
MGTCRYQDVARRAYVSRIVALVIGSPEKTYPQIADETGVSTPTVFRIAKEHGIHRKRGPKPKAATNG